MPWKAGTPIIPLQWWVSFSLLEPLHEGRGSSRLISLAVASTSLSFAAPIMAASLKDVCVELHIFA